MKYSKYIVVSILFFLLSSLSVIMILRAYIFKMSNSDQLIILRVLVRLICSARDTHVSPLVRADSRTDNSLPIEEEKPVRMLAVVVPVNPGRLYIYIYTYLDARHSRDRYFIRSSSIVGPLPGGVVWGGVASRSPHTFVWND